MTIQVMWVMMQCRFVNTVVSDSLEEHVLHLPGLDWTAPDRSHYLTMILKHSTSQVTLSVVSQSEHLCLEGKHIHCFMHFMKNT
jgi:hypothetical protein